MDNESLESNTIPPIEIGVQNGTLVCGRRGGHMRAKGGDRLVWVGARPFVLEFFRLIEENLVDDGGPDPVEVSGWPFSSPARPEDCQEPVTRFEGVLNEGPASYKYSVTMGNLRLDPIIIVDKR